MKNKIIKYVVYIMIILCIGCKKGDWFDVKSDKKLASPATLKDYQALMDNSAILNVNTPYLKEIASDGHSVTDEMAQTLYSEYKNAYTWSHEQRYEIVPDWIANGTTGSYRKVYYANLVLDGLIKIKPDGNKDSEDLVNIKGQALFHRAAAFYELAQEFAPQYELRSAKSSLGIPLRLESDINIPTKRSSVQQTYDQIIKDLTEAKDLLPITPIYKTRPSKNAVFALLARVYLSLENYELAGVYAGLSLEVNNTLMNYTTLTTTTTTNPIMVYNPEIIFYSAMGAATPLTFSNNLIDPNWYNLYDDNDLRKKVFFNRNVSTGLVTYKGTYCGVGFNFNFSGLATDELYLIRAECNARAGKTVEAMKDLNTLLKTRWTGPYTDLVAVDKEDALLKVLEERKKELVLRGLRWSDLRRLNLDSRFAITLSRTVGGKTYTLEPNSYKYTFPIPDDIIEKSGIEQNPGWE